MSAWNGGAWGGPPAVGPITLSPFNDSDAARVQAALDDGLAQSRSVYFRAGTYAIGTTVNLRGTGGRVTCHPNARFVSTIAPGSPINPDNAILFAPFLDPSPISTTLHATINPDVDLNTISVNASIPAGRYIVWGDGDNNLLESALVLAVSGSGPYTLTLNKLTRIAFTSGLPVTTIAPLVDFAWESGQFLGTGGNIIELPEVQGVTFTGIHIGPDDDGNAWGDGAMGGIAFSYDLASNRGVLSDSTIDGGGVGVGGASIESAEDCGFKRVTIIRTTSWAFWTPDARNCTLADCRGRLAGEEGLRAEQAANYGQRNLGLAVRGGDYSGNATQGVLVQSGAQGVALSGVSTQSNTGTGLYIAGASTVTAAGHVSNGNTYNVQTFDTSSTSIAGLIEGATKAGGDSVRAVAGQLHVHGWTHTGSSASGLGLVVRNGSVWVSGLDAKIINSYGWLVSDPDVTGAMHVSISDARFDISSGPVGVIGISLASSNDHVSVSRARFVGSKSGSTGIQLADVACSAYLGEIDYGSVASHTSFGGSSTHLTVTTS